MNALGKLGKPEQLEAMLPGVLTASLGAERDKAERNVADVCRRIENENERGDALIAALKTVDARKRDELISLLGRIGGNRLIRFVADIATSPDAFRRTFGIDGLNKWPDSCLADTLLEIAHNTKAPPGERRLVFLAYVKVFASHDDRNDRQRLERMKQAIKQTRRIEFESRDSMG